MNAAGAWSEAAGVLCVRLDAMGDVLMTTPAMRALKENAPRRRLTLLTSPAGRSIASMIPEIDECIVYEAPWMKSSAPHGASLDRRMIEELGARRFDAAAIFTVYSQNPLPAALLCYLAGIPLRLAHCRENPYHLLTHWVKEPEPESCIRHEVRRQLDLAAAVGCRASVETMSLRPGAAAFRSAGDILRRLGIRRDRPWVVVHPGSSAASRRYPPENFAIAVRRLIEESGYQVIFTGGAEERELVESVRGGAGLPAHSLAGELRLDEFAALLSLAPLLISNNTGPVHIAAAVGTPVVDLYALTNPQHTPWGVPHRVLSHDVPCKYCYRSVCPEGHNNCLRMISPDAVVCAVYDLMKEAGDLRLRKEGATV